MIITGTRTIDLRTETSAQKLGRDRVHRNPDPDYSAAILILETDSGVQGISEIFTLGGGNRWLCDMMKELAEATVVGMDINDFRDHRGTWWQKLAEHPHLRWHGQSGMYREIVGGIINALWDLDAKDKGLPMCGLLESLSPDEIVASVFWRPIKDKLTRERALELLQESARHRPTLSGVDAYLTRGWAGMDHGLLRSGLREALSAGLDAAKMKVHDTTDEDFEVYRIIREIMGDESLVMTDANQFFSAPDAVDYVRELKARGINFHWLEEMCHNDDIMAHVRLRDALAKIFDEEERPILVGGEHCGNFVMAKQFIYSGAYGAFQIDSTRVAGVNEVIAIMLMAMDMGIPVCPHGGGIGLCNKIVHYGFFDQTVISPQGMLLARAREKRPGVPESKLRRLVEYLDFLQSEAFVHPIQVANGKYQRPTAPGWGIEMKEDFIAKHTYPYGTHWLDKNSGMIG